MSYPRKLDLYLKKSQLTEQQSTKKPIQPLFDFFYELRHILDEQTRIKLLKKMPLEMEREKLLRQDPVVLIDYLREITDELITSHEAMESEARNDYEVQIQKFEADVRQHIRIEQQLKISVEKTREKYEEVEKEFHVEREKGVKTIKELTSEQEKLKNELEKIDSEMQKIKEELKNQHQIVNSQEEELKIMRKNRDQSTDQVSKIENFINKKESSKENLFKNNNIQPSHKRSTSTLQGMKIDSKPLLTENMKDDDNYKQNKNISKTVYTNSNDNLSVTLKQPTVAITKINNENKNLFSTFQVTKNSPLKKTQYNVPDPKYLKDKTLNTVDNNRSHSVDNNTKYYRLLKEKNSVEDENKPSQNNYDIARSIIPSNTLNKTRDTSRLRGSKNP